MKDLRHAECLNHFKVVTVMLIYDFSITLELEFSESNTDLCFIMF